MSVNLCGFMGWYPLWLHKCANAKVFLLIYGLLGTIKSIKSIYFNVTLTTLERRFEIPSQTTGILLSGSDISQILLSLILSYIGGGKNRPLWIAWGIVLCAISCFILVLPHAIYGGGLEALQLTKEYLYGNDKNITFLNESSVNHKIQDGQLCSIARSEIDCNPSTSTIPLILIFLAQFVLGIGNTLYYSLGHSYLDDNLKWSKTPMMLAFAVSLKFSGSAIGFALGYYSLSVFIDPTKTPLISVKDPRWLGAWWLGWIIIGIVMLIFAFLIGMFPKEMVKSNENVNGTNKTLQVKDVIIENSKNNPKLKGSIARILRNQLLLYNILSSIFFLLGSSVYMIYLSKYMEVQFNKSKASATIISGPMKVIGIISGILLSGFIITKYRPAPRILFLWNIIVGCGYMLSQFTYLFLVCSNEHTINVSGELDLINDCNSQCYCDSVAYNPVCDKSTNITYFSSCHAGCRMFDEYDKLYKECYCTQDSNLSMNDIVGIEFKNEENVWLYPGQCTVNCIYAFHAFNLILFVKSILGGSGRIGNMLLNLRVVSKQDKSIAQGLALMLISLFALIPGPILYGRIIDSTCLAWNYTCGDQQGYCKLYDQTKFRLYINLTAMTFTFVGVVFDFLVWYLGKNINLYDEKKQNGNVNIK